MLGELTISENQITDVPAYINNIIPISKCISQWGKMFAYNKISTFSTAELFGFMGSSIELKFNEIVEIPMHLIPNKDTIVSINLSNNKIKNIPKDIALFISLQQLYLEVNFIEVVPKELEGLVNLKSLNLGTFLVILRW